MERIDFWTNFLANLTTIIASSTALIFFFVNKKKIKSTFDFIGNYSYQLSISDLKYKIERLNDYNAEIVKENKEIIKILHDIEGQIFGNEILKSNLVLQQGKIAQYTSSGNPITEPTKRSLVSELRECVRLIEANSYNQNLNNRH